MEHANLSGEFPTDSIIDGDCEGCWPMSSLSYLVYDSAVLLDRKDCRRTLEVKKFFKWLLGVNADRVKYSMGFVPLSAKDKQRMMDMLDHQSLGCTGNYFM